MLKKNNLFILSIVFVVLLVFLMNFAFKIYRSQGSRINAESKLARAWYQANKGRVALVTGTSSGLGEALTRQLASRGLKVIMADILPARSQEIENEINNSGGTAFFIKTDLAESSERTQLINLALKKFGRIDFLFNNAGYGYMAETANVDFESAKKSFEVNFWACVHLAQLLIPVMQNQSAYIVNITSSVVLLPTIMSGPSAFYSASKNALRAWSEVLERELKPMRINVRTVAPGGMKTNYFKNMQGSGQDRVREQAMKYWNYFDEPEEIAKEILEALPNSTGLILPGRVREAVDYCKKNPC